MIKDNPDFKWLVTIFDCNKQKIEKYDVLRYREEDIKKLKKKYPTKEEFEKEFKIRCKSIFWSRAEYEVIIFTDENGRVYLKPWCGCRDDNCRVDVTFEDDDNFDWVEFALKQVKDIPKLPTNPYSIKIDVWDQLEYRWSEFVDFVWNYHHKWQRTTKT